MPVIPFRGWLPDRADYRNPGMIMAKNVLPTASGYAPVGTLSVITNALDARPRGAYGAMDKDANVHQYVGNASKLYRNVSGTWTDSSLGGGYSTGTEECWEFVQWENKVLATNFSDNPQQITMGGTAFSNLTTALKGRHIAKVRDFVVLANTFDAVDGNVPHRVRWSAFGDETDWTVSSTTLAGSNDLGQGSVKRVFGGEYGVVLQDRAVWRMSFIGSPDVWQFDETLPQLGLLAPGAAAQDGDTVYFLSHQGFVALTNGTEPAFIGANKVDSFVLSDLDENQINCMSSIADPASHRVYWAYPGAGNVNGRPNRIVVYDRTLDQWALIEDEVELVWAAGAIGYTLESLDNVSSSIDALTISLDSKAWVGGSPQLSAFDGAFKSGFFDGPPMTATLETGEIEMHAGNISTLHQFRGLVNSGTLTARVGTRNRQDEEVTWSGSLSRQASTGAFAPRATGRYHRIEYTLSDAWEAAFGTEIERDAARRVGRR